MEPRKSLEEKRPNPIMPKFTPEFLDELKARLRPSDVISKAIKLRKQGNEWAGLSPFTSEKTPSFFVNDQKGFYHCFSSGKHGDIISFLQETQRLSFYEAVERLAEEAGLALPTERPEDVARAQRANGLAEACDGARQFFEQSLHRNLGRGALDYLTQRGVTDAQIRHFSIGYAPASRNGLKDFLINKGFSEDVLIEAGLIIKPDDGSASYDRFRNRVMFPIKAARGRTIAFGGRALDPDARAKYLNSPETPLFHKGSVLYNLEAARSGDGDAVIVCEGYLDVIALWGAGYERAVAPLGTAMTENQLALLWRVSDEPVLCFDGDRAGIGAAYRAIDRALANLAPGKSLTFAFAPEGKDPDDLIRDAGPAAFQAVLEKAEPLVNVLWNREIESQPLDTPERRAAMRTRLCALVAQITDKDVRTAYGAEFRERLNALYAPKPAATQSRGSMGHGQQGQGYRGFNRGQFNKGRGGGGFRFVEPARPSAELKRRGGASNWSREAAILLAIINHPDLIERQEAAIFALEIEDPALRGLLREILTAFSTNPALDTSGLKSHLTGIGAAESLERVTNDPELSRNRFLRPDAEMDEVEQGFRNALDHHLFASTIKGEIGRTAAQIFTDGDEGWKAAAAAREALINRSKEDRESLSDDGLSADRFEDVLRSFKQTADKKLNG